jgi:alkylhydroperoxidase family enzyme
MRIPAWTSEKKTQPTELVDAILARRGGHLINLDTALLWSEPLARGWNVYLKAVRTELPTDRKLREMAICTVALLTGAAYEYHHHAPDFLSTGGTAEQLDVLQAYCEMTLTQFHVNPLGFPTAAVSHVLNPIEALVVQYAAQMTLTVKVEDFVFNSLKKHFSTTELVELTSAIATYNMVARFLVALDVNPEDRSHN